MIVRSLKLSGLKCPALAISTDRKSLNLLALEAMMADGVLVSAMLGCWHTSNASLATWFQISLDIRLHSTIINIQFVVLLVGFA